MKPAVELLWHLLASDRPALCGAMILAAFVLVGALAPLIAPYDPKQKHYDADGKLVRLSPPSRQHLFGTTTYGRDVFSQVVIGTRTALVVGVATALVVSVVGLNVGLLSGYFGGTLDAALMRITDVVYGVPILPFGIVTEEARRTLGEEGHQLRLRQFLNPALGEADDEAQLAVYLASDESRYMTGQLLAIDGGAFSHFPQAAEERERYPADV